MNVLLDFDGPICGVFLGRSSGTEVARAVWSRFGTSGGDGCSSGDPFAVLAQVPLARHSAAERYLARLEVECVSTAPVTAGAADAVRELASNGKRIAIVSNNSADAVRTFLTLHDWDGVIGHVSARDPDTAGRLKPDPFLLTGAMRALSAAPAACVMVGDSVTDMAAARAAGVSSIGYANKPGKADALTRSGARRVIASMAELPGVVRALGSSS